jgi:NADP-dependent 3-hydroxy acid dehydrogenase YdfG
MNGPMSAPLGTEIANLRYMQIKDSIMIVTGASSGIGDATARELARRGAKLVLAARRGTALSKLASELGPPAIAVATDVRDRHQIDELVAGAVREHGRIDAVINIAGLGGAGVIAEATDEQLEQLVLVNLLAPARLVQAALPHMKHNGSAAIVNIGSIAGEMGTNGMYSATKFGVRGLSDTLRRELREKHIAVSLIEPGYIRTPLTAGVRGDLPGPELVARAVAQVLIAPRRVLVVPGSWRFMLAGVRWFPALADRLFGSARGQARIHDRTAAGDLRSPAPEHRSVDGDGRRS